jgi:hypothetical protein
LLQRPDEPRKTEEPVEGSMSGAGFLCIEVKTDNEDGKSHENRQL